MRIWPSHVMLRHGAEAFLHAPSNPKNAFLGVSKGNVLVNELSMVFFYAIFAALKKSLSKGGKRYGVFILRKVGLEG